MTRETNNLDASCALTTGIGLAVSSDNSNPCIPSGHTTSCRGPVFLVRIPETIRIWVSAPLLERLNSLRASLDAALDQYHSKKVSSQPDPLGFESDLQGRRERSPDKQLF